MTLDGGASGRYLQQRLAIVEARVSAAVARRRAGDPDPDDRFRGLYISDTDVDHLLSASRKPVGVVPPDEETAGFLARVEAEADEAETQGADLRLRRLARSFGLDDYDVELLLIALAPDLDPRFERFYAYLHDDVSRRRASTGLALELCSSGLGGIVGRNRVNPLSPLVGGGLLLVEEPERPFLTRSLRVADRVASHLVGDDDPDPIVASLAAPWVEADLGDLEPLVRALRSGVRLCYLRERTGAAGQTLGVTALSRAGLRPLAIDLGRLDPGDDPGEVAASALREARLRGGGLVAGPIDVLAERGGGAVRALAEGPAPMILTGTRGWDPSWSKEVPLLVDAPVPSLVERNRIWSSALDGALPRGFDSAASTAQFLLAPEQVARAARAARQRAAAEARPVAAEDLQAGARAQNAAGLERLARRIEPKVGWEDLVLPPQVIAQLEELAARARHRDQVLDVWGMGKRSSKGRGITALFAGDSGTGKTMSAEVAAGDLGLDLYVIDLSTVIDKYIGETEKNLDRIFVEADRVNGVLLFDEADAIFGKRSDVKDSHDRYANVEVAYLLQRMELFNGLAILTTNLRSNVDEAFTRRLDAVVDFPMPEEEDRRRLWEKNLRAELPKEPDIDLDFLARAFRLSGGNIRNIAVAGAYLAASESRPVAMRDLIRATEREYRKLGHLCVEAEFGPYYRLIADPEPWRPPHSGSRSGEPSQPRASSEDQPYPQTLRRLS
jgi:ATPase family associated with various cellular activities (AAA)